MNGKRKYLIDADKFEKFVHKHRAAYMFKEDILAAIANQPTVDAVEVVRCANCQYWNPRYETMGMCMKHNSIVTFTKPDFYCAWGKGKKMGFARKIKRANAPKVPRCCKMNMRRKMGYDTETHDFYFCEKCGKEKWVKNPNCGAKMDGDGNGS